jgi:sugar-phosphatase
MKQFLCRAVIFDLDGVLIDSSAVVQRQWQRWIAEHGLDPNQALNVMGGRRLVEIIRHVAPHLNPEYEANRLAAWEAADTDGLCEIEGASQLVSALPKGTWAVVTSGNRNTALTRLTYARLPMPDVLVTADDVTQGKPHPEPYLRAAERLDIPPAGCLVVEDASACVEAARAAGMRVIAVATTHSPDALEGADAITADVSDIQIVTIGDEAVQRGGRPVRLSVSQIIQTSPIHCPLAPSLGICS